MILSDYQTTEDRRDKDEETPAPEEKPEKRPQSETKTPKPSKPKQKPRKEVKARYLEKVPGIVII